MNWSDEQADKLRQMAAGGASLDQMAAELSVGRGAISGKMARLGLHTIRRRDGPSKRIIGPSKNGASPKAPPQAHLASLRAAFDMASQATDRPDERSPKAVTFKKLKPHHCRWPLGDPGTPEFRFCGVRRVDPLPYCGLHCRTAYRPPR